jgi:CPA1 family monovalent cation:H+ antiporter
MHIFDLIALLIFLSGFFIFINTFYLKLPPSVGLMILTLGLSLVVVFIGYLFPSLNLAEHVKAYDFREVLNQLVISVILFAGALNLDISRLGKQKWPVVALAVIGTLLSTFIIGSLVYLILNALGIEITYLYSLIFGAIISSTDPVSSSSITKRFSLPKMLEVKVEGESLLNGAFAVVIAFVLYHIAINTGNEPLTLIEVLKVTGLEIFGGIIVGVGMGYIGYKVLQYIENDDVHIEVLITIAMVMVGSFISQYLEIYSKMVALIMGLMIGNLGRAKQQSADDVAVGKYVYKFWRLMEETMAVMLFVLMGLEMLMLSWRLDYFAAGFLAVNIVLLGRWISIFIPVKLLKFKYRFDENTVSVMTWGAFRGGLPIALILALGNFPGKELMITMTYVVVVSSILFQGFTLPIMMREKFMNKVF